MLASQNDRPELAAVASAVRRVVSTRRSVQAAFVFGSVASGRARRDSDVDVAVLLSKRPADVLTFRLGLMADLGHALGRSDVDIIILNGATPLLAQRVLSRGSLVFERSASARVRFQVSTASRYLDLVPTYEACIRSLKSGLRRRRAGG